MSKTSTPPSNPREYTPWVILILLCLLYGILIPQELIGFFNDEGLYIMASKALAEIQSYQYIYQPNEPFVTSYPPLLSLLLAPLWFIHSTFPDNVLLFKLDILLISMLFLYALSEYLRNQKDLSTSLRWTILLLFGLNLYWVESVTTVLSEPLFCLLSLGVIIKAQPLLESSPTEGGTCPTSTKCTLFSLILLSILLLYTRSIAFLLIFALGLMLFQQRQWKTAVAYWVSTGLASIPWFLWVQGHPDSVEPYGSFLLRNFNESYKTQIANTLQYEYHGNFIQLYLNGISELAVSLGKTFLPFFSPENDFIFILGIGILALFIGNGLYHFREKKLSLIGLYLTAYLAFLPLWPYPFQYTRFLVCILPFLWIQLFKMAGNRFDLQRKSILWPTAGMLILGYCTALNGMFQNYQALLPEAEDFNRTILAIQQIATPQDRLWSDRHAVSFALYSERHFFDQFLYFPDQETKKIVDEFNETEARQRIQTLYQTKANTLFQVLKDKHVQYFVANRQNNHYDLATELLLQTYPTHFQLRFTSPAQLIEVYQLTP